MIWECLQCRDRVSGPKAPPKEDRCRICVHCTLRFGRFIQRRQRQRAGKVAKAHPKLANMWRGIDLQREMRRLLPFCPPSLQNNPPRLVLAHRSSQPRNGVAFADLEKHEIEIRLWPSCPSAWALGSLIHEMAHFAVDGWRHDEGWRQAMLELLRDGYGVEPRFPSNRTSQALDHAVEDALHLWVKERSDLDEMIEKELYAWAKRQLARDRKKRGRTSCRG